MSTTTLRKRSEIPDIYKWKLEDIYPTDQDWENEVELALKLAGEIRELEGKLGDSAAVLLDYFKRMDQLSYYTGRIEIYSNERMHQDTRVPKYQAYVAKCDDCMVKISGFTSFANPEILAIPEERIAAFYEEEPQLLHYKRLIDQLFQKKAHTLSAAEEAILAEAGTLAHGPQDIYSMFNNADVKFPYVTDVLGNKIRITHGNFIGFLHSTDRSLRKQAFVALYDAYAKMGNTIAATYIAHVKQERFFSKMRKYESTRAMHLASGNIPEEVYDNLIKSVHDHLPVLHRYVALRKKLLGVDQLHMYDLYVPIVTDIGKKHDILEAKRIVAMALEPMGEEYVSNLKKGMDSGWIDVYENEGKRTGAYSWGTYGTHPYVLMNYQNDLDSVFTLAHEMGHSMHTWFSNKTQSITYANYLIFVAEVASTCNECLLSDYLLNHTDEEIEQRYLINHMLEEFRTTVFRQALFAEFEHIVHTRIAEGEPLTMESINKIYYDLNKLYYGPDMFVDDEIAYEWMRIPHFYSSYYVYQYSIGFSAATAFSQKILKEGKPAVDRYIGEFISQGGSKDPIDLLRNAGVDLSTPEPIDQALDVFEDYLNQLEKRVFMK